MLNYKVVKQGKVYLVWENQTNQAIKAFTTKKEATDFARKYNFGLAFDGWTPRFVLNNI